MLTKVDDIHRLGLCLLDCCAVLLSMFLAAYTGHMIITSETVITLVVLHIAVFYVSNAFKHFGRRGYFEEIQALLHYSVWFISGISLISLATNHIFIITRRAALLLIIYNFFFCYIIHALVKWYLSTRTTAVKSRKVFLITTVDRLSDIQKRMNAAKNWGGVVSAIAIADSFKITQNEVLTYFPYAELVGWNEIEEFVVSHVVDEFFINLSHEYDDLVISLINKFEVLGAKISVNIRQFDLMIEATKKVQRLAGYQVVTFSQKFHNQGELVLKRLLDLIGSIIGLMLTFLVGLVVVPLIMLESPGSPIYTHNRIGENGRVFKFYKFRSMYMDADERKAELMKDNQMDGFMFKMDNDPRVTKIGKFIRKTSLDELPQFFNVLRGDMSLVGTRPPTEQEYKEYSAKHKRRLSFKPGITGLWQVSGRNEITDFDDVVRLDVEYIQNWNIWLDIKILLLTIKVVILGKGAK